jgi:hypothetical protein
MHYRCRCNISNSFGNAKLFRYVYKGRLVKISSNVARGKQDGEKGHYILTAGIRAAGIGRSMVKCNCHRLKYLVLYYKRVIALILRIIN